MNSNQDHPLSHHKKISLSVPDLDESLNLTSVENTLSGLPGVSHISIIPVERKVIFQANSTDAIKACIETLTQSGFKLLSKHQTFALSGMHCASCSLRIEKSLIRQAGVISANTNLANHSVHIHYLPEIISPQEMQGVIAAEGYQLILTSDANKRDSRKDIDQEKRGKQALLRAVGSGVLSIPVLILGMFLMHYPYAGWLSALLTAPVVFIFGWPFFQKALLHARHARANMDTLVALSTFIAFSFSLFNLLNPSFFTQRGLEPHLYFEAAAVIITFILLGRWLEERGRRKTSQALHNLIEIQPSTVVRVLPGNLSEEIGLDQVNPEDILLVRPGQRIPVDGIVVWGESYVKEAEITGEPSPVRKVSGEKVYAGTLNQKGSFKIKALRVGEETFLAQVIKRVEEAQGSKAPVQKIADKVAGIFVPTVMVIALITLGAWLLLGGENGLSHGLLSMITVLIIACPCALGLATPTAIMAGIGKAANMGILIQDARSLEMAGRIDTVVLDKTGTLTEGRPRVTAIQWISPHLSQTLEPLLYSLEKLSEHPLAEAITSYFQDKAITETEVEDFESLAGLGVYARAGDRMILAGSQAFLLSRGITIPRELLRMAEEWNLAARSVVFFSVEKEIQAIVGIEDALKPSSHLAVEQLHKMNIEVHILSGDQLQTAKIIGQQVGIKHIKAGVMPAEKADYIKALQASGRKVAVAGDGINDSEALTLADVSLAMGNGSELAMDVAQMTIISSDLTRIPAAILLSRKTIRTIRQNLFWAFIYNILGIPIAAGLLYPINGFLLNPMIAGGMMAFSSVSVVTNSLRLRKSKLHAS